MSKYINSVNRLCVNLLLFLVLTFIAYSAYADSPEIVYTYSEFISPGNVKIHAAIKTQGEDIYYWYLCYRSDAGSWRTVVQSTGGDTGTAHTETTLTEVSQDAETEYWLFVANATDTVWSGKQSTNGWTPVSSPSYFNFIIDSITTTSYRCQLTVNPNGYACAIQYVWGRDDYTWDRIRNLNIPASANDTVVSYIIDDLTPYDIGRTWMRVANATYNNVGGVTRHKSVQTLYDSSALGLTTPIILFSKSKVYGRSLNFGVNTYGHYCYDIGLGEDRLPPCAPGYDIRFIDSRTGSGACLTDGTYIDIREYSSPAQIDTYKVQIQVDAEYFPLTFTWQDLSSKYSDPVILKTFEDSIDMRTTTSYSFSNPEIKVVRIIAAGPRPTPFQPSIMAKNPTVGSSTVATLESMVNPNGSSGNSWFEWGTTDQYDSVSGLNQVPTSFSAHNVLCEVSGLSQGIDYHYRTVVQTSLGRFYGIDQIFRTGEPTNIIDLGIPGDQFRLFQNYPNPFNPTTTITYQIPISEKVAIKVYTLLGNEIATLVDEKKSPGTYQVTWNADQYPSGVYYYRMIAGLDSRTGKLLLLR